MTRTTNQPVAVLSIYLATRRRAAGCARGCGEFVTADAREHGGLSQRRRQGTGDGRQQLVAGAVTEGVADVFEVVDVDQQQRAGRVGVARAYATARLSSTVNRRRLKTDRDRYERALVRLGSNGIAISMGKLAVYTAAAGIDPDGVTH